MPQQSYCVFLPRYSVGPNAYDFFEEVLYPYGKKVAILGGEHALEKAKPSLLPALEKAGCTVTDCAVYGKNSTQANVDRAKARKGFQEADVIVGVGGGRAIDTAKAVAYEMHKPVFVCPTVASNCAPTSALSVIYKENGALDHYVFLPSCPVHTFLNTEVIINSPRELFWAGIGDALSKQCEVFMATEGKTLPHTPLMGQVLAGACQEPLLQFGQQALEDFDAKRVSAAFSECVLDIIVTTGVVSNLTTDRQYYYNSSGSHCFYNAYTVLPYSDKHLHGEVVSFGNLCLEAYRGDDALLERFVQFNISVGLPVTLEQLDIRSDKDLDTLCQHLPTSKMEWPNLTAPVSIERYKLAILKADEFGRKALAAAN